MDDNAGRYAVLNGTIIEISDTLVFKTEDISANAAYEVIRIINGVPLFFEDHYERLKNTFGSIGRQLQLSAGQLGDNIKKLLAATETGNCNVKIIVSDNDDSQQQMVYISKSYYPTEAEVLVGVKTGLFRIERHNPNAKILNKAYKDAVNARITEGGYFEVILVDSTGSVTEGSKSNLFFVKGERILTAPGDKVLKGITRKYVFDACRKSGFEVTEELIDADEICMMDGAFLSGTSIKVLPISTIDNIAINSAANPVINAVEHEYDIILEKYIEKHVKIW